MSEWRTVPVDPTTAEMALGVTAAFFIRYKEMTISVLETSDGLIVDGAHVHRHGRVAGGAARQQARNRLEKLRDRVAQRGPLYDKAKTGAPAHE